MKEDSPPATNLSHGGNEATPSATLQGRRPLAGVSALWAAFLVYLVVVSTQAAQASYYVIVRGVGTVQAPDVLTVVSPRWDAFTLVGLAVAVLFLHTLLLDRRGLPGAVSVMSLLGLCGGLVAFLFSSSASLLLVGASSAGVLVTGARSLSSRYGIRSMSVGASVLQWLLLSAAAVSVLSAAEWLWAGMGGPYPVYVGAIGFAMASLELLGLSYPVISWLILAFLFSWVVRLALRSKGSPVWTVESEGRVPGAEHSSGGRWPLVFLGIAVGIAVFVRVYVYLPSINPLGLRVGTDAIRGYACWLGLAPAGIPFNECVPSWWDLHIGALWFLQGINVLVASPDLTLKIAPALWGVLFDFTTYILVKEGTGDSMLAGVSALLSAVSLETLIGIDAGILANWLALPVAFLFFAVILRVLRTRRALYLVPASALFVALFLIHPWTWFLMAVILAGFLAVELLQGWRGGTVQGMKLEAGVLSALLAIGAVALLASTRLSTIGGLYAGYDAAIGSIGLSNWTFTVVNLQQSLIKWVGGGEANPIWFILGIAGVLSLPNLRGRFSKLLLIWLAAISLSIPFADANSLIQERVIFDIPIQIFAAMGAVALSGMLTRSLPPGSFMRFRGHDIVLPVMVLTVTLLALSFDLEYIGFLFRI